MCNHSDNIKTFNIVCVRVFVMYEVWNSQHYGKFVMHEISWLDFGAMASLVNFVCCHECYENIVTKKCGVQNCLCLQLCIGGEWGLLFRHLSYSSKDHTAQCGN